MKRTFYLLLMSIFFWGCPQEEDIPSNFFDETLAWSERYAVQQENFVLPHGDYFVFQLENKNQTELYSFDRDTNNNVTYDSYDPDGDGITIEDRGIDQVPVLIPAPINPIGDITINYRLYSRYTTKFRLLDENQNNKVGSKN